MCSHQVITVVSLRARACELIGYRSVYGVLPISCAELRFWRPNPTRTPSCGAYRRVSWARCVAPKHVRPVLLVGREMEPSRTLSDAARCESGQESRCDLRTHTVRPASRRPWGAHGEVMIRGAPVKA